MRPRGRALKLLILTLLLCGCAAVACYFFYYYTEKPRPTVTGWRASVITLAGDGAPGTRDDDGANDGDAKKIVSPRTARFADPFGVAVDAHGNVYIADAGESNRIRKLTPEGLLSTFAGGAVEGFADGQGAAASFNTPSSLAIDLRGNIYVADTGNNAIRRITPEGLVTTLAGDGTNGHRDGPGQTAQFNSPVGVAVDALGNVYVADTYNDCVRQINAGGLVTTLTGKDVQPARPGYLDGPAGQALFDTPCGVAVALGGEIYVADTGNNFIRRISADHQSVTTLALASNGADGQDSSNILANPLGLALTYDNYLYVSEGGGETRIWQITPDHRLYKIAGAGRGYADGDGNTLARFNRLAEIAVDKTGALYVADAANYLVRKIAPRASEENSAAKKETSEANASVMPASEAIPRLNAETLGLTELSWPVDPQGSWHEVTGTMGEVRGSYDGESRDHFHSGVDVQGGYGAPVRAIKDEKVANPLGNWGLGGVNEGMSVGVMTYIHQRVGRNERDEPFKDARFIYTYDEAGKITRVRVRRGARFHVGDQLGTINRMYHVHLNLGPWSAEINPLTLPLAGFGDHVAPTIERDGGIQLFDATTQKRLTAKRDGRLIVGRGDVKIVVDAYDQVDGNLARRRLGLYRLGYQLLRADDQTPVAGYEQPRITMLFDRLPPENDAVKIAYAGMSGITVYGSAATKFLYEITNIVRDGHAAASTWSTNDLPSGAYILRIIAADHAGNEATTGRDVPIIVE